MALKCERRLRRLARRAARAEAKALRPIALGAIRYVNEIYAPNLKEPFSIANRRADLVDLVRAHQSKNGARRAA